jgi:hypothetical protein
VLGDASPVGQASEPSGGVAISDGLEIAGLVVAVAVGFPAAVVAVATIKAHLRSQRQSVAGKRDVYMRHKRLQYLAGEMWPWPMVAPLKQPRGWLRYTRGSFMYSTTYGVLYIRG